MVVKGGARAALRLEVQCDATGIRVVVLQAGTDPDMDGFRLIVDDQPPRPLAPVDVQVISRLGTGSHQLRVEGIAANCGLAGTNPRSVQVEFRKVADVELAIACVSITGDVEVEVATRGNEPDLDAYRVSVDGAAPVVVAANGKVTRRGLGGGARNVALTDLPPNCQLEGDHTRAVTVQTGTAERHVARVVFEVQCARAEKIAFSETSSGGTNRVVVAHADGSRPREVVDGMQPSWSPDGAELVYARPLCSYYYGCPESVGLARLAPADGQPVPFSITNEGHDSEPAWSPQGDRIAFSRIRAGRTGLWVVAPTGGTATALQLPPQVQQASAPAWAPDGQRLAFACTIVPGHSDICVIGVDGTGFARLTDDPAFDGHPAWRPDGQAIAFTTTRFDGRGRVAVMSPEGGAVTPLAAGSAPAWSRDGSLLVFAPLDCPAGPGACVQDGLAVIRADGTGFRRISTGAKYAPAWRP